MVPFVQPLKVGYQHRFSIVEHATITLTAEPWVSAKTVEAAYRRVQKEMLGRENRPLAGVGLDILRFCLARPGRRWEQLMAEWNDSNRDRRYADRRNFARDFARAERQLRRPGYGSKRQARPALTDSQADSQPSGNNASNVM
jgi:hypothetical protein